jgi:hypothetical protein
MNKVNNLDNPKTYGGTSSQLSDPQTASTLDAPYNIQLGGSDTNKMNTTLWEPQFKEIA